MSNFTSFSDLAKKQANARKTDKYTPAELRRVVLAESSAALLALSDSKIVSDADLSRLMQTGFGLSIGPYMRALFPPQVNPANPMDVVPPAYREAAAEKAAAIAEAGDAASAQAAEEAAAIAEAGDAALPAPPHDFRDKTVRCGDLMFEPVGRPYIGKGDDGYHKHWFQVSGPYFGEGEYFNDEEGKDTVEAGKDQDSEFWRALEGKKQKPHGWF